MPRAVSGLWRATTRPATYPFLPWDARLMAWTVNTGAKRRGRRSSSRCFPAESPVAA